MVLNRKTFYDALRPVNAIVGELSNLKRSTERPSPSRRSGRLVAIAGYAAFGSGRVLLGGIWLSTWRFAPQWDRSISSPTLPLEPRQFGESRPRKGG